MQAAHGGTASLPSSGTPSLNGPSAIPKNHRYSSSRSNSFSSASIVTVKRTASLSSSSGTGARNSTAPIRAQSPVETSLITLRVGLEPLPQDQKRRKSAAIETAERTENTPLASSHRYSNSTSSSGASGSNTRRNRASSGALAGGFTAQGFSPKKKSAGTIDYSPRASVQKLPLSRSSSRVKTSPTASPERERRHPSRPDLGNAVNGLPSLHTTPALTDSNDNESPSTIQTVTTPSTQTSHDPNYFWHGNVSPENPAKGPPPIVMRSNTAPIVAMDTLHSQAVEGAQYAESVGDQRIHENGERPESAAKARNTDSQNDSSKPHTGKESGRNKARTRERGEKDKKSMLAKALQQANTAVLLDNAQNYEGAIEAYSDACKLLQQVTERSSGQDDKRKLNAIRYTYTTRIEELRQIELAHPEISDEKSLPDRPVSDDSFAISPPLKSPGIDYTLKDTTSSTPATVTDVPIVSHPEGTLNGFHPSTNRVISDAALRETELPKSPVRPRHAFDEEKVPLKQSSVRQTPAKPETVILTTGERDFAESPALETSPLKMKVADMSPPQHDMYIPAPLSPIRRSAPQRENEPQQSLPDEPIFLFPEEGEDDGQEAKERISQGRKENNTPVAWLDTIDEGASSRASSVHSVSSQRGLHRKYLRGESGISSNPDFDAAFDAAVEAAYDQGLEPDPQGAKLRQETRKKHETNASTGVRNSEIDEITSPSAQYRFYGEHHSPVEDAEDERMLDEIAQDYAQTFGFDVSGKSALPRQSDSSAYSRSTWQSSQTSDRTTAGSSLSTVAEDVIPHSVSKNAFVSSPSRASPPVDPPPPPPLKGPPPQTSLPKLPGTNQSRLSGVRGRRLSGQPTKQLKIETPGKPDPGKRASTVQSSSPVKEDAEHREELNSEFDFGTSVRPLTAPQSQHENANKSPPSSDTLSASAALDSSRPMTSTSSDPGRSLEEDASELRVHNVTSANKDQASHGSREHMLLLASPTVESAPYLGTPLSSTFMNFSSKRMNETPLTSQRANLRSFAGSATGGSYSEVLLFDTSLSEPQTALSPRSPAIPTGVEPCPTSFLQRPFWLMRNLSLTLTHPRGGYLTSRLFIPREVWQTKSMKLKYLEDKIANCDLLIAALGRLAGIDTYDADAIMEELQSFEDVLERVQNALSKKLGSEVGTSGMPFMFKDTPAGTASGPNGLLAPDTSLGAEKVKGYLSSWRKLRSKSSGSSTSGAQPHKSLGKSLARDALNMSSVPMTTFVPIERRGNRKDARKILFDGPNKEYLSTLARLFDGVAVLDQIARQVEDPGLKGTSQTHVGLELSIRHAAEFFAFYVCRFVLADLGVLMDKFLKKGSEWMLT